MATKVIAIIGKSASGKDTFYRHLKGRFDFNFIVSHTTREPRPNEKDGVDYFFTPKKDFEEKIKEGLFLETNIFNNWYYGISKEVFKNDTINMVVIDPAGYKKLKEIFGDENTLGIHIKTPLFIRIKRYIKRDGCFKFEVIRRIVADFKDFKKVDKLSNTYILKGTRHLAYNEEIFKEVVNKWIENTLD